LSLLGMQPDSVSGTVDRVNNFVGPIYWRGQSVPRSFRQEKIVPASMSLASLTTG